MTKLDGQVAIVTGGGSGIGQATAKMLAAEGAQVVIAGRRRDPLERVAKEIQGVGGKVHVRACDVAKYQDATGLVNWTLETCGKVLRWVPQDQWEAVMGVNLTAVYALTQAVLPGMIARGGGTIVTVSSLAAIKPGLIGGAPYGAAKAAANNLMGHVHTVLRDQGIRATVIMPAEVDTPILDNRPLPPDAAARSTMMQPEDVASAILLAVTLPPRTVIEEMIISPTRTRDQSKDIEVARHMGASAS